MADPNLADFHNRVSRIESARAKGLGHEAAGTLGRAGCSKPQRRRSRLLPILFLTCSFFALKGVMHYEVGSVTYDARVQRLSSGEGFDRLGGLLMRADPVTLWVAGRVAKIVSPGA